MRGDGTEALLYRVPYRTPSPQPSPPSKGEREQKKSRCQSQLNLSNVEADLRTCLGGGERTNTPEKRHAAGANTQVRPYEASRIIFMLCGHG